MNLKQLLQGKIRVNNKFPFVNTRDTACIICNHIVNGESPILFVSHDEDDWYVAILMWWITWSGRCESSCIRRSV